MPDNDIQAFIKRHLRHAEPLSRDVNLAHWRASTSGNPDDFSRCAELQIALQRVYSRRDDFERIRAWRQAGCDDALLRRQIDLLYFSYLRNQIEPELNERITKLASKIENRFNVHRAQIDGRSVTTNDIVGILKDSGSSKEREKAWRASKEVGAVVRDELISLVRLRNEAAESLGFSNYHTMALELGEQREEEILSIFDALEAETREPFRIMKQTMDERLAARCGISVEALRPWHYEDPFFQESPQVFDVDADVFYTNTDIVEVVTAFFDEIGLGARDIVERSDLFERAGKDQHAFCIDIDRMGDIRVLANVMNDEMWTGTMLHELGHAVHDKYIDQSLPYLLRQEAHIFTTEAVAMLFGRLSKHPGWIVRAAGVATGEVDRAASGLVMGQRMQQLVFARWSQVMFRFERELYNNPERDLDALWWELVSCYQMLNAPEETAYPHWASKTHIVSVPVYYHNYQLGELLASQFAHVLRSSVLQGADDDFTGNTAVGDYMRDRIFAPGARRRWDSMVVNATGEPLSAKYFVEEFVTSSTPG